MCTDFSLKAFLAKLVHWRCYANGYLECYFQGLESSNIIEQKSGMKETCLIQHFLSHHFSTRRQFSDDESVLHFFGYGMFISTNEMILND